MLLIAVKILQAKENGMRLVRYIFFLLFTLLQIGFSQSGMLTGKVVDEDTGQPVKGAGIRVLGTGLKNANR
jgi:hypothetical protein